MAAIRHISVIPLMEPVDRTADLDGSNATIVVQIEDDEGHVGIGECDAPPMAVQALFDAPSLHAWSMNLRDPLIGLDPFDIGAIWQKIYQATFWHGRRGIGIHALSAIDIALHDLLGRRLGVPVYKLLGGARRETLQPYATIYPGQPQGRSMKTVIDEVHGLFDRALKLGFRAVKMEVLFEDLATDSDLVDYIREGRQMVGADVTMMLDFGYRWHDWHDALQLLRRLEDENIYFAEAPLQHDDLLGHARLSERAPTRICGAEAAATRYEIREWIEVGKVSVVQPNIGRAGGFTEMRRIADICELYGVQCIPHGWKTGITTACSLHYQAACPNVPFIEYLAPELYDSDMRRSLVEPASYALEDGEIPLPDETGLGIRLNPDALERFRWPDRTEAGIG
ncbi:MAG: mandelate racemase/muconate lactonizing enzyme family protein [Boseongicola sp.]|nr:mandelate racemase/muconate lactonizing enzyme family protein [Boseongicola sp.]